MLKRRRSFRKRRSVTLVPTKDRALQGSGRSRLFHELVRWACSVCLFTLPSALYARPPTQPSRRCALIHCHRPDLLDYDKLDKARCMIDWPFMVLITRPQADRHENTRLALQVAAEHLGIPVRPSDELCRPRLTVAVATPRG